MHARFDFTDKHVFIFGGTSGINLGIARCFAEAGAHVAVASRSEDKVEAAVSALRKLGPGAEGFALDVRDPEAVEAALADYAKKHGDLDVLISGAAGNFPPFTRIAGARTTTGVTSTGPGSAVPSGKWA